MSATPGRPLPGGTEFGWIGSFEPESWLGLRSSKVTEPRRTAPPPLSSRQGRLARYVAGLVGAIMHRR